MILKKWESLPQNMRCESIRRYYDILETKKLSLIAKRVFDVIVAIIIFIILSPIFILISVAIKLDSDGQIMYRQTRVTQYGKKFKIFKFRTMVSDADKIGRQITTKDDARVTKIGIILRKLRLDETPQLLNIISGDMTFVGPRPEVTKYVDQYTNEMWATLLIPAGVTSEASIKYKDEEKLLSNTEKVEETYINEVLPAKMEYNLRSIKEFSFLNDIKTMFRTIVAVFKSEQKIKTKVYNEKADNKEVSKYE